MKSLATFLCFLLTCTYAHMPDTNRRASIIKGDIYLAGFFPIHERDRKRVCGEIDEEGLQQLESFLYSIKKINEDESILPGITLGAIGIDSCYSPTRVFHIAMTFMKFFIASNKNLRQELKCENNTDLVYNGEFNRMIGVIGGRSSGVSIQLANLMRIFKIPQVSYKATAPLLSNKNLYDYFFRTVPPVRHQVEALFEIIQYFRWQYISVVYSDSDYGNAAFEILQVITGRKGICFATQQRVDIETFEDSDYNDVLDALLAEKATAVVLFGEQPLARNIMKAAKNKGAHDRFVWLGSEAWCSRDYVIEDYEEYAEGMLCVAYTTKPPLGYYEHFKSLTPENTERSNPWFYELWEQKKKCRLPRYSDTLYNQNFTENCVGPIPDEAYMQNMPSAHLVKNAVYAFAHSLNEIHREKCKGKSGWCEEMGSLNGNLLMKHLFRIRFNDDNGNLFEFDTSGDAIPRFAIANYQKNQTHNTYYWRDVGTYIKYDYYGMKFHLDEDKMVFKHFKKDFPESICSRPCLPGETKVLLDSNRCCWSCFNCSNFQYISTKGECKDCEKGFKPSKNKTFCEPIPERYMNFKSTWAVICITFAVIGLITTVAIALVFYKHWDTPIIKASARELSALLLIGIFLSFLSTFPIVSRPTKATCGIVRFFIGFNFTICYAAIVTKTRRIALIFERRGRKLKPKYTSPQSQLMIAAVIMAVEAVINATWLMYDAPSTSHAYPTRDSNILICGGSDRPSYLLGLLYPFLLMILCTVYAFKTRKCPDGFNEARFITFTNYTTWVIWLAFIPTFTFHRCSQVRTFTLSILLSSSAAVQLVCLFLPKAYIAILQPQNNTKDTVMAHAGAQVSSTSTC